MTHGEIQVNGLRYHYRAAMSAASHANRPLVLIHGLGASSAYWARLQPLLAHDRPVYAVDLPGFGASDQSIPALNVPCLAEHVAAWLAALRLPPVDLLGHSLGGPVAAALAEQQPESIARLILAAPTIGRRGPHLLVRGWDLLRDAFREDPTLFPVIVPAYLRAGVSRILRTERFAGNDDLVARVARLRQPLLIVRGDRDCVVDRALVELLLASARTTHLVEIPGAAHGLHWSHARALALIAHDFLTATGASREVGLAGIQNARREREHLLASPASLRNGREQPVAPLIN